MASAPPPIVHTLDDAKAERLGGRTMLMPSPQQVREAILKIPLGNTKTLVQLRNELAASAGADITCPVAARQCWYMVAFAAEEDRQAGVDPIAPWWRVTKNNLPEKRLPGGEQRHRELLLEEGIALKN